MIGDVPPLLSLKTVAACAMSSVHMSADITKFMVH